MRTQNAVIGASLAMVLASCGLMVRSSPAEWRVKDGVELASDMTEIPVVVNLDGLCLDGERDVKEYVGEPEVTYGSETVEIVIPLLDRLSDGCAGFFGEYALNVQLEEELGSRRLVGSS